jgi:hypothetical protein
MIEGLSLPIEIAFNYREKDLFGGESGWQKFPSDPVNDYKKGLNRA